MLVVAALVMLGSTAAGGRAHADVIGMFTGSWQMQSNADDIAARTDQSIDRLQSPGAISGLDGYFGFTGVISNYSQQGCVPFEVPCTQTWSGTFSGGTVSFAAVGPTTEYTVTGVITGGSFSGRGGMHSRRVSRVQPGNVQLHLDVDPIRFVGFGRGAQPLDLARYSRRHQLLYR